VIDVQQVPAGVMTERIREITKTVAALLVSEGLEVDQGMIA
jgi:hypothetical protein